MTSEADPQDEIPEWKRRLLEAAADHQRRRAEAARWRQEFAERRSHGLRARHRQKLARRTETEETP